MESLGLIIVIAVSVIAVLSIVLIIANNWLKAEPNEALIFTGRKNRVQTSDGRVIVRGWRAVVGGAKLRIPIMERVNRISLKTMNLADVRVEKAYSKEGVPVTIDAVANVKISGDEGMLDRAVERFLGTDARQIQQIIKETLEGQLRDIIGVLTVEELYQKRDMFVNKVLDQAGEELAKIGVIIDIINIQDIRDERGYLEALGIKRTAEVKRDAAIGQAQADRDAMQKSETARREGEVVRAEQEKQIAEAEKNRDVAKQEYRGETLAANKKAEQQGPLAEARARQEVVVQEQKVLEEQQKARAKVESAKAQAEEQKYRAEVVVPADAEKQAAILKADGEAQAILRVAEARAKGTQMQLEAEAKGLREKAQAWNAYGKAAQLNLTLEAIKVVAEHGAKSIGQVKFDKVIALDSGGSNGDNAVNRLMTAAPGALVKFLEQMKAATGVDIEKRLQEIADMPDDESMAVASGAAVPPASPEKPKSVSKEKD
jgi:flotillin